MNCFNSVTSPSSQITTVATSPTPISPGCNGAVEGGRAAMESSNASPISSGVGTPTVDLTSEYTMAFQTSSYNEIWAIIHGPNSVSVDQVQVLNPDRDSIEQVLQQARPTNLTRLVSDYFDGSERTSNLCFSLQRSVEQVRSLYEPIHELLDHLPSSSSSITQVQCDWAFDVLTQFHLNDNPFPSDANFEDMRHCFFQLRQQLSRHLRKARNRLRLFRRFTSCKAICLVGTALGIAVSTIVIATHALAALVAAPFIALLPMPEQRSHQQHRISQLDAAAKGTYVLHNDLHTIDRLVARVYATVESDKELVRYSLERGRDKYLILEVVKQLRKNRPNFLNQLKDLEEHVCLCFTTVNRARSLLFQEIHRHQSCNSQRNCLCFEN